MHLLHNTLQPAYDNYTFQLVCYQINTWLKMMKHVNPDITFGTLID